jgi:hypothetical protein
MYSSIITLEVEALLSTLKVMREAGVLTTNILECLSTMTMFFKQEERDWVEFMSFP